jgi:hypothetical protein
VRSKIHDSLVESSREGNAVIIIEQDVALVKKTNYNSNRLEVKIPRKSKSVQIDYLQVNDL